MRQSDNPRTRLWAGLLAVAVGLTLVAPPFAGAEPKPAAPPAAKSIRAATSAKLATLDSSTAVQFSEAGGAAASGESSQPFLKSRKGVAAVLLLVGGFDVGGHLPVPGRGSFTGAEVRRKS